MARITVLCPDMSINCLGRADLLARLLQPRHEVQVVGPMFGDAVWEPLRDQDRMPYVAVPTPRQGLRAGRTSWDKVEAALDGDLLYVSKPFATSLRAARRFRRRGGRVLLDIDDWEPGILRGDRRGQPLVQRWSRGLRDLGSVHHRTAWNTWLGDAGARRIPARTVSNRFLQERYGGTLVWHARDADDFDPARHDGAAQRAALGIPPDGPLVAFLGTPRGHKGVDDLIEAVARLPGTQARLAIVGVETGSSAVPLRSLAARRLADRAHLVPPVPFSRLPALLAMADIVAIPQQDSPAARGQMPAKVFDAMAMGKPIVATAVSDLPEVLDGCGVVVPPSDTVALSQALLDLIEDPAKAQSLGQAARRRFLERYSLAAARAVLLPVVDGVLEGPADKP